MRRRINPRAVRIMVTMMVSLAIFKTASVVSNADTLPGVEYRVCQSSDGWESWKRNAQTSGDITTSKKLEAVKVILTDTTEGDINYKVYVAGSGWSTLGTNGMTVGSTEGIQAIKVALTGDLADTYKVVYRVHSLGGDWSGWVKGPEVAGDVSGTTPIDGMEIALVDGSGQKVNTAAEDYSETLPVTDGQNQVAVQETAVDRGESVSDITSEVGQSIEGVTSNVQQAVDNATTAVQQAVDSATTAAQNATQIAENTVQAVDNTLNNTGVQTEQEQTVQTQPVDDKATKNIEKIIRIAKEEQGYKQEADGRTKYGSWWANKVGDNAFTNAKWSSMFLAWCGNQAGLSDEQYGYYACSQYWKNWFVEKSAYHAANGYTPKAGDIIFMDDDADGESNHNGIVIGVEGNKVITIEGNVAGETKQCEYELSNTTLLGYGTPFYGMEQTQVVVQQQEQQVQPSTEGATGAVGNVSGLEKLSTPLEGIDVSEFNTITSWSSVAQNTDFAYIRLGGRSTAGKVFTDADYAENIQAAINNGVKVGVYFYTQAITVAEAEEEAAFVLNKVKDYKLTYPIAVDSEKSPSGTRTDNLSKAKRTEIIKAFMDKITAAGYKAQLYSGKYYLYDKFNMDDLSGRDIWVAQYYKTRSKSPITDFKYPFSVWQYSDQGKINGISGYVDKNLCYVKY